MTPNGRDLFFPFCFPFNAASSHSDHMQEGLFRVLQSQAAVLWLHTHCARHALGMTSDKGWAILSCMPADLWYLHLTVSETAVHVHF